MSKYLLLFFFFFLIYPSVTQACSCIKITYEELIQRADLIFTGTLNSVEIVEVKENDRKREFQKLTFQVEKNYLEPGDNSEVILFESNDACSYNFVRSLNMTEHNKFMIFGLLVADEEIVFAPHTLDNTVYFTGYCSGSFMVEPPEWNYEHLTVEEQLHLIDTYFEAGLNQQSVTPENLYNEVWKDGVFHWFYTHDSPTHPEGYGVEQDYFASWLQLCGLEEMKEDEWLGVISVSFTVTKEGELINIVPFSFSETTVCYDEAVRVVEKMPKWIPAKVHGIPVSARTSVQVDFRKILE
jgi:hypothetical protein